MITPAPAQALTPTGHTGQRPLPVQLLQYVSAEKQLQPGELATIKEDRLHCFPILAGPYHRTGGDAERYGEELTGLYDVLENCDALSRAE